ncbi:hypothetical protein EZV62_027019 [Acer yangbiense]|uniref:non-specific serine/threonine protein kinase n=1 Tax=Acer yangbiense TaxID=1000413 RepID=A0A5C7GT14_9ROSI|nr:hypothetical protein EZV62_027019 [Acer yangbiense]
MLEMTVPRYLFTVSVLVLSCFLTQTFAASRLPQDEVDVLNQIAKTMGATNWTFGSDACEGTYDVKQVVQTDPIRNITCDCEIENNTCHVTVIKFMLYSLPGTLPPELVRLLYISEIDFAYNYLKGSIPLEWASMQLKYISVFANRLSGNIPNHLGKITSLTYLDLDQNQFSGMIPPELGKLVNLKTLRLSSNRFSGILPLELAELKNLTNFRINDNNFTGSIPEYISSWSGLSRLEIQGSGLKGPIPPSLFVLEKLTQIRISDIHGTNQSFPVLTNMTGLTRVILKNCGISGGIPEYIWGMKNLRFLDLSFNELTGELTNVAISASFKFMDLSYNNFSLQSIEQSACREKLNLNLNLFRNWHSFYINCGGDTVKVNGRTFEGDSGVGGGAAIYHLFDGTNWGFSSTGDFTDDDDEQNTHYIATSNSSNISELYIDARIVPTSLTYFGYCLENGNYTVNLHFAEIRFTNDNTYSSIGRRMFDIYVQDKLVEKDFDIEAKAPGVRNPLIVTYNANVTNNILEIRFYWAGKGTTAIPVGGVYGPLISAISVESKFKPRYREGKKKAMSIGVAVAVAVVGLCLIILMLGILYRRRYLITKRWREKDLTGLDLQTSSFTLRQIKAATNNFDPVNKIGEGGFGPVYKGLLSDGTIIAVKQLSSKSRQGNREFLNEIGIISCLQHPNLVKIYGCCIEKDQLLLIYEYMENNSLARALFDPFVVAFHLYQNGKLMELVDQNLGFEFDKVEAEGMMKVALLCANASPSLRPTMSEVVNMLEGTTPLPDAIPEAGSYSEDMKFKALRDKRLMMRNHIYHSASTSSSSGPSSTHDDVREVNAEKYMKFKAMRDSRLQLERQNSLAQISTSDSLPLTSSSSEPAQDVHYTI